MPAFIPNFWLVDPSMAHLSQVFCSPQLAQRHLGCRDGGDRPVTETGAFHVGGAAVAGASGMLVVNVGKSRWQYEGYNQVMGVPKLAGWFVSWKILI